MVKITLAISGTLHSLSGGGKVIVRAKYQQRPEKQLFKFPEETDKYSERSCVVGVWYTEMDQALCSYTILYFIHTVLDVFSVNLGMVDAECWFKVQIFLYSKYPIPKYFPVHVRLPPAFANARNSEPYSEVAYGSSR